MQSSVHNGAFNTVKPRINAGARFQCVSRYSVAREVPKRDKAGTRCARSIIYIKSGKNNPCACRGSPQGDSGIRSNYRAESPNMGVIFIIIRHVIFELVELEFEED